MDDPSHDPKPRRGLVPKRTNVLQPGIEEVEASRDESSVVRHVLEIPRMVREGDAGTEKTAEAQNAVDFLEDSQEPVLGAEEGWDVLQNLFGVHVVEGFVGYRPGGLEEIEAQVDLRGVEIGVLPARPVIVAASQVHPTRILVPGGPPGEEALVHTTKLTASEHNGRFAPNSHG